MRRRIHFTMPGFLAMLVLLLAACQPVVLPLPAAPAATEAMVTPSVTVADQDIVDGTVTIAEVVSDGPGWLVIHAQKDGKPGPVLGHSAVSDGVNTNVVVEIDVSGAAETLYAMLHTDAGTVGTYEFPGPDGPVKVGDKVVTPAFNVTGGLPAPEAAVPTVMLGGNDELGDFLVGANGMTLYVFTNDEPGKSNCYDRCAQNWPPLLVEQGEEPVAGEGVPGELGVIEREDGGFQVTYNDMPLYFWIKDTKPGDATGHGVNDVWFVAAP